MISKNNNVHIQLFSSPPIIKIPIILFSALFRALHLHISLPVRITGEEEDEEDGPASRSIGGTHGITGN